MDVNAAFTHNKNAPSQFTCRERLFVGLPKNENHRQDYKTLLLSQSGSVLSVASQLSLRNSGIADRTVGFRMTCGKDLT